MIVCLPNSSGRLKIEESIINARDMSIKKNIPSTIYIGFFESPVFPGLGGRGVCRLLGEELAAVAIVFPILFSYALGE